MTGMGKSLSSSNTLIVDAFHHALWLQFLIVLAIGALLAVVRSALRARQFAGTRPSIGSESVVQSPAPVHEPTGRRVLRVGFGLLWILDGILQGQSAMPLSLPSQVLQPAAAGSPSWLVHLVTFGANAWSDHPVTAAAAAVWIQVGVGLLLLVAPAGRWSRFAGALSVGWGLMVWVFGEALGAILAPGASWLFGAPGAAFLYVVAGAVLMLPERVWTTPSLGRWLLRATGTFFVGMAVLQAWPGRGFWQGQTRSPSSTPGGLVAMVRQMSQTPQPSLLASLLRAFGRFDTAHGWAVNLFVVIALAVIGTALWSSRPRLLRWAVGAAVVLCLATGCSCKTWGSSGASGPTPTAWSPWGCSSWGDISGPRERRWPSPLPTAKPCPVAGRPRDPGALVPVPSDRRRRGLGRRADRGGAHGRVGDELPCRSDLAGGAKRGPGARRRASPALPTGRPVRPGRHAVELPGSHRRGDLPRPGVHERLSGDRPGAPGGRRHARLPVQAGRDGRDRVQPDLRLHPVHAGLRPPGVPLVRPQLVLPDRHRRPAEGTRSGVSGPPRSSSPPGRWWTTASLRW